MTRNGRTVSTSSRQRAGAGILAAAALLLPWRASPESSLQSGARTASVGASAHVDFRIVIPPVLALSVAADAPTPRVAVMSNTRQVLLTATPLLAVDPAAAPAAGLDRAMPQHGALATEHAAAAAPRRAVLLTAGRGAVITATTACQLGEPRAVASGRRKGPPIIDRRPVVCTVAMP